MDLEIDGHALGLTGGEPLAEADKRHLMDDDVLGADATTRMLTAQPGSLKQVQEFRGHPR